MRSAPIELQPTTPFSLRLFDRIPLPAFFAGIVVGLATFAVFLVYTALLGDGPGRLAGVAFANAWLAELHQDLFLGFSLAVVAASLRGVREEHEALRPELVTPVGAGAGLEQQVFRFPRWSLVAVALCALLVGAGTVASPGMWESGSMPGWTHPTVVWVFTRNSVAWMLALRGMVFELVGGSRFSRLADSVATVDLFDHAALEPFARRALRNVSLWMLLTAWMALNFAGPGWAIPSLLVPGIVALVGFAVTAFLLPLRGPHRRLRDAKRAELQRVRAAIQTARDRVLDAPATDATGGRLADLIAYETRVANASEWPIAAPTVARFALYLALGLGSWVGAGIVQHGIETALR